MTTSIQATLMATQQRKTSHVMHLILTIITGTLWLPIWAIIGFINVSHNHNLLNDYNRANGLPAKFSVTKLLLGTLILFNLYIAVSMFAVLSGAL